MSLRIYLTGQIFIESGGSLLDDRNFPSRQCRRAFVYLVCERAHPVARDALADVLWASKLPPAWDTALSALISKLRRCLEQMGLAGTCSVSSGYGCYQIRLPDDTWVDLEAARAAIHEAEGTFRQGSAQRAWGPANVAATIARRPFLPGEEGEWVDQQRAKLHGVLIRALDCLSDIWLANGESALAVETAREAVKLEPFRETGWQRLMRVHARAGNRAQALHAYEECRTLLAGELGADPSPQTEELYLELLRASSPQRA